MKVLFSLREAFADAQLMAHVMPGDSYRVQKVMMLGALGEELDADEVAIFKKFTGGRDYKPGKRVKEFVGVAGRRTAKSLSLGALGTYFLGCCDYSDVLVPGETGTLLCLAQTQRVATQILDFIQENLERSPVLRQRFVKRVGDTIELTNNLRCEVRPASMRNLRGPAYIDIFADEMSHWYVEDVYANPDSEVLGAARPGLMTTGGMTVMMSSPYSKRGLLYDAYKQNFGPNGDPNVLVYKGTTHDLNPLIPEEEIARELERNPTINRAEYLAEFRTDIEAYLPIEAIEQCCGDYLVLAPTRDCTYRVFVDASGGSGLDSFACAVSHREQGDMVIIDGCWEWPAPFSPEHVISEIAAICRSYRVAKVIGDRFGGGFPPEGFQKHSIAYEHTKLTKSDFYRDMVPLLMSKRIMLPKNTRMINQAAGLERTVGHSGRDIIDHQPGGSDDLINAVAGAASLAFGGRSLFGADAVWLSDSDIQQPDASAGQSYAAFSAAEAKISWPDWVLERLGKKPKAETPIGEKERDEAAEREAEARENAAFRQREYIMQNLNGGGPLPGRQFDWSRMPNFRDQLFRR